jgi:hypothetical protein
MLSSPYYACFHLFINPNFLLNLFLGPCCLLGFYWPRIELIALKQSKKLSIMKSKISFIANITTDINQ